MAKNVQSAKHTSKFLTPVVVWIVVLLIIAIIVVFIGSIFGLSVASIVATILATPTAAVVAQLTSKSEQVTLSITKVWRIFFLILGFSGFQLLFNSWVDINGIDAENWFSGIVIENETLPKLFPKDIAKLLVFLCLSVASYLMVAYIGQSIFVDLGYPSVIIATSLSFIFILTFPSKLMIPMDATFANFLDSWENLFKPSVLLIVAIVWAFFILAAVGGMTLGKQFHRSNINE